MLLTDNQTYTCENLTLADSASLHRKTVTVMTSIQIVWVLAGQVKKLRTNFDEILEVNSFGGRKTENFSEFLDG